MKRKFNLSILIIITAIFSFYPNSKETKTTTTNKKEHTQKVAYFAAGCFWCVEHIFESLKGVTEVVSGYSGGTAEDANYEAVCSGKTNHAETVAIYYDSTQIDYATLLVAFFASHDPTTLNRQGPDKGRHYRSAIFYTSTYERDLSNNYIKQLLNEKKFSKITTEVTAFEAFYKAETYHQDFKTNNPNNSYIQCVSVPRFEAFRKQYPELLKE